MNDFNGKKYLFSDTEWKARLSKDQYHILREKSTEPAFHNEYYHNKDEGVYHCQACDLPVFSSDDKYDSGSGWPSFTKPISPKNIIAISDSSHGMDRTEVTCARCDSHLGHVFEDGPVPTNKRYCINSGALSFKKN